jgi:hypothetical protein
MDDADLLQLTHEALDLATAACHFDKEENFVGAYDYYDKCILNLDEIMGKLPPTTSQWRKLMDLRTQYDDRMDQLKELENNRGSLFGFNKNSDTTRSSLSTSSKKKPKFGNEGFQFHEMSITEEFVFEEPPKNLAEIPFWQLRNVKKSIETGAFFTKSLFITKHIWQQADGVKFSGLNAKTAAFEIILNLMANDIDSLYFSADDDSLTLAEHTFFTVEEELMSLRNQLSKSFPYIKEMSLISSTASVVSSSARNEESESSSHLTDNNNNNNNNTNMTNINNSNNNTITSNPSTSGSQHANNPSNPTNPNPNPSQDSFPSPSPSPYPPLSSSSNKVSVLFPSLFFSSLAIESNIIYLLSFSFSLSSFFSFRSPTLTTLTTRRESLT